MVEYYNLNDIIKMKKKHPCGDDIFKVIRTGMDVKIKCRGCGRIVMLPHEKFIKRAKKVIGHEEK